MMCHLRFFDCYGDLPWKYIAAYYTFYTLYFQLFFCLVDTLLYAIDSVFLTFLLLLSDVFDNFDL